MTRARLLTALVLGSIGFVAARLLDFEPRPLPYAVTVGLLFSLLWLVVDTAGAPDAQWQRGMPPAPDRVDQPTTDLRVLTSHQQSSVPPDTLRIRLVALARLRDPELADHLAEELATSSRLSPAEIDRILTRIEDVRDRP